MSFLMKHKKREAIKKTGRYFSLSKLFILIALLGNFSSHQVFARQEVGKPAFDFTLSSTDGKSIQLSKFQGKVVVLDFCASWCEPCKQELEELKKIHQAIQSPEVVFLAVNVDSEYENGLAQAKNAHLPFPFLFDLKQNVVTQYDPEKMPSSYVIDKKGVVRYLHAGYGGIKDMVQLRLQIFLLKKEASAENK